jgi:hypothetical protein
VQDRYAGDVGDFQKFGFLRWVCDGEGVEPLRLGVNWYLVPDEAHNADGKHIGYLNPSNRLARSLSACDPDLYSRLSVLVAEGRRTVRNLELAGVLPPTAVTFDVPLRPGMMRSARDSWHRQSLEVLCQADVVFVDPDNGVSGRAWRTDHHKFVFSHEIADYLRRGHSVIVYHHADRSPGGVPVQVERRMLELQRSTGTDPIGIVVARRGSCRFFIVLPAPSHRQVLERSLAAYSKRWHPHTELWRFATP